MTEDEAQRSGSEVAAKAAAAKSSFIGESLKKKKSITDAGLGAPVFETLPRPEQMEGQVLKYGSPAYQNKYGANEQIVLKGATKRLEEAADKKLAASEPRVVLTRKQIQKRRIMQNIKAKNQILVDIKKAESQRLTTMECRRALKNHGLPSDLQMSIRGVRPCFRPLTGTGSRTDCQLMTFHTSSVPSKSSEDTSTKMSLRLHVLQVQSERFHERTEAMPDLTESLLEHIEV